MTEIEKKAKEFTEYLYESYGSGTGVLFGIPSNCRESVYTIIKLVMEKEENIIQELRNKNPYPEDIFIETPQMDKQKINKYCKDNGISIDGYNGSWGRKVWNNCIDNLKQLKEGER